MAIAEQSPHNRRTPEEVKQYIGDFIGDSKDVGMVFWGVGIGETTRNGQTVACVYLYVSPALTRAQRSHLPAELFGVALEYNYSPLPVPEASSADTIAQTNGLLMNAIAVLLQTTEAKENT